MSRTVLNKLLAHSLNNYSVLFNELSFHNHNAHHLGSLYFLGATNGQLEKANETMCKELDPYTPSPEKIDLTNWRTFLGNKDFCQSYRDFFRDQLKTDENQWKNKLIEFLMDNEGQQPMINGAVCGLAHPLIHIGYAFELDSLDVAIEALAMTAVCYNYIHETIDQLQPPQSPSKTAWEIFQNIRTDSQFPIYEKPGVGNLEKTVRNCSEQIFVHYNQWNISREDLPKVIEELFDLTVYIYGATHKPSEIEFDFFLLHLLTSMHAIRMISLHLSDQQVVEKILYQFFYFAIVMYVSQVRPKIDRDLIHNYEIDPAKHNWKYVIDRSLNTELVDDAHLVKVVRAFRDAEEVYGNKNNFYLKTAVKTVDNMNLENLWIGGPDNKRQLNILKA